MAVTIEPGTTKIGWIGTGVMGSSMCGHLIDAGFSATVYTRSKEKAAALLEKGADWADSPKAVAENSDVIFAIVGFPSDVRAVFLGEDGALAGSKEGNVLVDMTTSDPSLAVEIYEAAKAKGVSSVDAPVSGGDVGAKEARLSIMIGGDEDVVSALDPCWNAMGKTIVHQGGAGAGQHTKMVNQTLIATNMIGVCEALLYGYKAGLDLPTVMQSVSTGAAGSWSLSNLGPRIMDNNFDPGFFVEPSTKAKRWVSPCRASRWLISFTWHCRLRGTAATELTLWNWLWPACPVSTGETGEAEAANSNLTPLSPV